MLLFSLGRIIDEGPNPKNRPKVERMAPRYQCREDSVSIEALKRREPRRRNLRQQAVGLATSTGYIYLTIYIRMRRSRVSNPQNRKDLIFRSRFPEGILKLPFAPDTSIEIVMLGNTSRGRFCNRHSVRERLDAQLHAVCPDHDVVPVRIIRCRASLRFIVSIRAVNASARF